MEGKLDVDEGGEGLDGAVVLRVLDKVADAGLEVGVPVEDVELGVQEGLSNVNHSSHRWEKAVSGQRRKENSRYLILLEGLLTRLGHRHGLLGPNKEGFSEVPGAEVGADWLVGRRGACATGNAYPGAHVPNSTLE